jgi:probable rRNA maturation factor
MKLYFSNWSELERYFPNISFSKSDLEKILNASFEKFNIKELSIVFVNSDEITKLNKDFRKKNQPTDVLAFTVEQEPLFGEIYICPEYIAKKYDQEEILRNIVHGILHLVGYEHKGHFRDGKTQNEDMFVKQENILHNILYEINNGIGKSRKKISSNKA